MRKEFLFAFALLLAAFAFSTVSLAMTVKDPQNVEYMKAEVVQTGSVSVSGASDINISIYMPQSDSSQASEIEEVSNPNYFLERDKYGNRKINMFWKNPGSEITFRIKTLVTVNRKNSGNFYSIGDFSRPTELIQSDDSEIKALAENITIGKKTDFEKIGALTKWVNENIQYDLAYSDVNLSATAVLHLGKGVCDEFSTLLLSMARSLGYQSSYLVGYAYGKGYTFSEGDFAAHGWTEIYTPSGVFVSDPTWGEIPVDASHIRFASLADSIYPEVNVSGIGKSPKIKINPTKTEIRVIEVREKPVIESSSSLLDSEVWKGYAVAKTDLTSSGCVFTKISAQSCTIGRDYLLQPMQNDSAVYFCGSKTVFSLFRIPELDANRIYTCPISISAYNSNQNMLNLTLQEKPAVSVKLSLDKTAAEEGEKIAAQSANAYVFTSDGQSGFGSAVFTANDNMAVYAYSGGALDKQSVSMVKEKPFDVFIAVNETYFANETGLVNATIRNLLQKNLQAILKFGNNATLVYLEPLSEKTVSFDFAPRSKDDNFLQVYASSGDFSSYASKLVSVQQIKTENWWDGIAESAAGFFKWISESAGAFFGGLFGAR